MQTAPPDSEETIHEQTAEAARVAAVSESESHTWNGVPLQPWGEACASLHARLVALDLPGGDLDELPRIQARLAEKQAAEPELRHLSLEDVVDLQTYLPTAAKLLYIAAEPREKWFHLRARPMTLIAEVEAWTAANIAPDQACAACLLAQKISTTHLQVLALRRVKRMGVSADAGN